MKKVVRRWKATRTLDDPLAGLAKIVPGFVMDVRAWATFLSDSLRSSPDSGRECDQGPQSRPTGSRLCCIVAAAGAGEMATEVACSTDGSDAVCVCSVGSLTVFAAALFLVTAFFGCNFLVATSPTDTHWCMLVSIFGVERW